MENYEKRLLLLNILPGLGKSYLGKHNVNFIDYEDWVENRGLKYKERKGIDVVEDINTIVNEIAVLSPQADVYICSSIAWEDFNTDMFTSTLYVSMAEDEYDCAEVIFRGRFDLCDKVGDELITWNNDYIGRKNRTISKYAEYILDSKALLSKDRIIELLSDFEGYPIQGSYL